MTNAITKISRAALAIVLATALSACTTASAIDVAPYEITNERYAAIVVDADTGRTIHALRADETRYPASLAKMMTLYLLFEHMQTNRLGLAARMPISANAAGKPASKLYLKPGDTITMREAIQALAVKSANDVATATAEFVAGTELKFAARMTLKALALGMRNTTFRNASGLPDKGMVSTARDMAKLGIALRKRFPSYRRYFALRSFEFRGKTIRGHNRVLGRLKGADGLKTGYTRASGFNLATSLKHRNRNIVAVIMGENSGKIRDQHMVELITSYVPSAAVK